MDLIDCDCHLLPLDAFDYVEGELAGKKPILKFDEAGILQSIDFPGRPEEVRGSVARGFASAGSGAVHKGIYDLEVRLGAYEAMGIERQVILPQLGGWWNYLIERELGAALARSYNLAMLRLTEKYRGRIFAAAQVALQDVQSAIAELEWAVERGFKGVVVDHTYPVLEHPFGEPTPTRRELWPFFARAAELAMPIYFHAVQHGHRLRNLQMLQRDAVGDYFLPPLIDHQLTLVACITSGLLDEFPTLQVIHTEMYTGFIRELAEKMDRMFDESPSFIQKPPLDGRTPFAGNGSGLYNFLTPEESAAKNTLPPSEYFKRNFFWTIETEEPSLTDAVHYLGAEHFLFATDYPHDDPGGLMKFEDSRLFESNESLSPGEKALIGSKNALRLFSLAS